VSHETYGRVFAIFRKVNASGMLTCGEVGEAGMFDSIPRSCKPVGKVSITLMRTSLLGTARSDELCLGISVEDLLCCLFLAKVFLTCAGLFVLVLRTGCDEFRLEEEVSVVIVSLLRDKSLICKLSL